MERMKSVDFNRLCVYDSDEENQIVIDFPKDLQWKMCVDHIRIVLNDGEVWTDPVAFLKLTAENAQMQNYVLTNGAVKLRSPAIPVLWPDQATRTACMGVMRGYSNSGPTSFSFSILGSDKKTVEHKRLYIVFKIMTEDGKV